MEKAPVILFCYNRKECLVKTVEALEKNIEAKDSELFIFSDGAKSGEEEKVNEVREYLETISGFKKITIEKSSENKGLANSIIYGVTKIINKYGQAIILEDDIVTSPYFLKFMNEALEMYKNDEKVASISGYTFKTNKKLPNTFFIKMISSLGWATWKRAWDLFEPDGRKLLEEVKSKNLEKEFDFNNSYPYLKMLNDQIEGKNSSWAIRFYASMFLQDKLCLFNQKSLCKNIGFDGSGTHCGKSDKYYVDFIFAPFTLKKIKVEENQKARRLFEKSFQKSLCKEKFKLIRKEKDGNKRRITILGFIKISYKKKEKMLPNGLVLGSNSVLLKSANFENADNHKILIGEKSMLGCNFVFESDKGEIIIGDRTFINGGTNLISREKIEIGNDVVIAWGCTLYDHNSHSLDYKERIKDIEQVFKDYKETGNVIANKNWDSVKSRPIKINDKAWIGFDCTILNGVTIGEGAIIGAKSVVRKDVEPYTIVAGNPAQKIGDVEK